MTNSTTTPEFARPAAEPARTAAEPARTAAGGGKYLTFALGREEYGLQILKVREIIGCTDITPIPRASACVKGVINLRGQIITVIDLRARFAMEPAPRTEQTCIIVVEHRPPRQNLPDAARKANVGIIVDRVCEVLNVPAESIEDAPALGAGAGGEVILGLGKIGSAVKILIDIDAVLAGAQMPVLPQADETKASAA